jgi:hypothetical protein
VIQTGEILRVVEALNREGVEYKVFGGGAVNFHGLPRSTEDIDFFVSPEHENVARIKRALRSIWNDPNLDEIQEDDMLGDYPSFQYNPPGEAFWIDFVSRLGEAFQYSDLESEVIDVSGVPVRVVTPATLYRMKRDTVRPKDKIDAQALRLRFDLKD